MENIRRAAPVPHALTLAGPAWAGIYSTVRFRSNGVSTSTLIGLVSSALLVPRTIPERQQRRPGVGSWCIHCRRPCQAASCGL